MNIPSHPSRSRFLFGPIVPSLSERRTLPRFLVGMVFQGIWWAGYLLVPYVLAKSLAAPGSLITLAVTLDTGGMLLALYWGSLLNRGHGRRLVFWAGVGGRLILLLALTIHTAAAFMALLVAVYFFAALVYPAQNGILQANFRPQLQGRIWGLGALVQNLTAVVTSLVVGKILDHDPGRFGSVYAVIGACGFVYLWILSRLPRAAAAPAAKPQDQLPPAWRGPSGLAGLLRALARPFREALATFQQDRAYFWYEANFMSYGLAFLMLYAILPILFTDRLHLAYEQISTARIVIASLGVALLGPTMGRAMDRYHPVRLCQFAFGWLVLFPTGLLLAVNLNVSRPVDLVYVTFGVYALGMAAVNITWNVGSISFAPAGRGSHYQGVHVAMVGIRGLVGPALGFSVYRLLGLAQVFLLAAALFALASLSSGFLWRWLQRRGHMGSPTISSGDDNSTGDDHERAAREIPDLPGAHERADPR